MATRRIRHELRVIATSAGMLLLAAGCNRTSGSSSNSASGASSAATPAAETATDACTLLTEEDATAFLGADPGKGTHDPDDPNNLHTCSYYTTKGKHNVVNLLVREKAGGETAAAVKSGLAAIENEFPSSRPVAGIGDAAVWIPGVRQLDFVKGTTMYLVTAGHGSLDEAKALALKVLGRL